MSEMLEFDRRAADQLLAMYATPEVSAQRRATLEMLALRPGERVLDVGSGPGLLACEMAELVGPGGRVEGVDNNGAMLAIAADRCLAHEHDWVAFHNGSATKLPFEDTAFDGAVSTQVLEYVSDVDLALVEAYRVLKPGGRLLIVDTDWGTAVWRTAEPERMARVLRAWDEHLAHPALPRTLGARLQAAGFELNAWQAHPMFTLDYREPGYASGVIRLVERFVPGRQGVSEAEAAAWAAEQRRLAAQGQFYFSLNRYLFLARKPV